MSKHKKNEKKTPTATFSPPVSEIEFPRTGPHIPAPPENDSRIITSGMIDVLFGVRQAAVRHKLTLQGQLVFQGMGQCRLGKVVRVGVGAEAIPTCGLFGVKMIDVDGPQRFSFLEDVDLTPSSPSTCASWERKVSFD